MFKDQAKLQVQELVRKYEQVRNSGLLSKYTEEETKKDFILPLFQTLGWNISDKNEVSAEESQSNGRVDYGFYLGGRLKFYLEAKPLRSDLHKEEYANQAIKYSWNKGATWAILTDFESLKFFNAQIIERGLADKLYFEIPVDQYIERFDQLWLLSKEAISENLIDKEAEKIGKKLQRISVGASLYKDLTRCRDVLTDKLGKMNSNVESELLDEGVQKLLDRLIFIRVAEDRGIEQPTLLPLIRQWNSSKNKNEISLYKSMATKFRELDKTYNSNLFTPHPLEDWQDWSNVTEQVVKILQGKPGYYEYDFKDIPADVLGSVYENYLGYRLSKSKKGLTLSKDAKKRKEHGIYYTPDFIVDYIVRNTLTPVLDRCKSIQDLKKIKILDPACGSGSFLIKALNLVSKKYREFDRRGWSHTKMSILVNNIYGIDLDPQAVELTRLNLLLSVLGSRAKLPLLDKNIKNGNSLISGRDEELKKYFGKKFKDKKPFNWKEEFPEVFRQGGFDVIIGNPPYIQLSMEDKLDESLKNFLLEKYRLSMGRLNTFGFFIVRGLNLLKEKGLLGYIIPNTLLTQDYYEGLRKLILSSSLVESITNFDLLPFKDAVVENIIIVLQKSEDNSKSTHSVKVDSFNEMFQTQKVGELKQASFGASHRSSFNLNLSLANLRLKEKIEDSTLLLSHFLDINQGIALKHDRKKYLSSQKQGEDYKPVLDGRFIDCYLIRWNGDYLKYDISAIHSSKNERIFLTKEKLLFRRVGVNLIAAYDNKQFYALNTLVVMNLKNNPQYDLKYFLGLFNSSLFNFYYKTFLKSTKKVFSEIQARQVGQLPVKLINFKHSAEKTTYNNIKNLVEKMINLRFEYSISIENSNKWRQLKEEVKKTDKKINEEVYKLYGLTAEEIGIVKNQPKRQSKS